MSHRRVQPRLDLVDVGVQQARQPRGWPNDGRCHTWWPCPWVLTVGKAVVELTVSVEPSNPLSVEERVLVGAVGWRGYAVGAASMHFIEHALQLVQ